MLPRRRAWLRIFVVRWGLPCDPPVWGHSCNGGMIPKADRQVEGMLPKTAWGEPRPIGQGNKSIYVALLYCGFFCRNSKIAHFVTVITSASCFPRLRYRMTRTLPHDAALAAGSPTWLSKKDAYKTPRTPFFFRLTPRQYRRRHCGRER